MLGKEKIQKIFDSFNELKVLVIGDVMIDSYLWGDVERISPEAPVPVVNIKKKENRLGGAANVALNIKALGANPILCSVIGDDDKGDLFFNLLKKQNISNKGILKSNNRITSVKFRIISGNTQMLRVDEETDLNINFEEKKKLLWIINNLLEKEKIKVIVFEDYDKGIISSDFIQKIISKAKELDIPVVADPKTRNFKSYKNISLFKPNLKELKQGLKLDSDPQNIKNLADIINDFQNKQNIKNILVTLSKEGIFVSSKQSLYKDKNITVKTIPAYIRNIADVSGAGDTVVSVAALCIALNLDPEIIASISNIAGGLVCEKVGVVPIDKKRFLKEVLLLLSDKS
jgi:rfaE bifunctional protein kinase chain/domain